MPIDPRIQAALDAPHGAGRALTEAKSKVKRGYAAPPGTGPFTETCRTCRHLGAVQHTENTFRCQIAKRGPMGAAYFISPTADACRRWEQRG